jgi:tetratricopeptide (TPR) repeat protein
MISSSAAIRKLFLVLAILLTLAAETFAAPGISPRESVMKIVVQIQRADYEGDRAALQRLYQKLAPFTGTREISSRVLYWRGFALWRRAINGFNDSVDPNELEHDVTLALHEFQEAITADPQFVDAKVGAGSCFSLLVYLHRQDPARVQELVAQSSPLLREALAAAPDNPRLLWVVGGIRWNLPPERGGGQEQAIATYQKGLDSARKQSTASNDSLEPSWGEPELLMSLAWSNLNRITPDLDAAERYAQQALQLVPYWHYARDILVPQIKKARTKSSQP